MSQAIDVFPHAQVQHAANACACASCDEAARDGDSDRGLIFGAAWP